MTTNNDKKTFIMATSWYDLIGELEKDQKADVLDAIFLFRLGEEVNLADKDPTVRVVLNFIFSQMRENDRKYEETCQKRKEAGSKGGKSKANANFAKQEEANKANANFAKHNDNDNDNDNDINKISYDNKIIKRERERDKDNINILVNTEGKQTDSLRVSQSFNSQSQKGSNGNKRPKKPREPADEIDKLDLSKFDI